MSISRDNAVAGEPRLPPATSLKAAPPSPALAAPDHQAALHSPGSAWFMTAMLCLLLLLSFVDRYSLTVMVDPIRQEFALTDGQMGLILGASFAVFYSLFGLPLGWLVDRVNRRNLVVAGVLIWSVMTMASGYATGFFDLLVARLGVGLGEAVLTPAAFSLIRDAFPADRRGRALSLYLFGANIGTGMSLVVVGRLLAMLDGSVTKSNLGLAGMSDWRVVLLLIGAAGIPLALLTLLVREPRRAVAAVSNTGNGALIGELAARKATYGLLILAFALWGLCTYSIGAWLPTALSRAWSLPTGSVASPYGAIAMASAPMAALLTSLGLDRLAGPPRGSAAMLLCALAAFVTVPAVAVAPLGIAGGVSWIGAGFQVFASMCIQVTLSSLIAQIAPGPIVGRITAGCYLSMNLVGLGLGPSLVAWAAGRMPDSNMALSLGLSLVASLAWLCFGLVVLGLRRIRRNSLA